MSTFEMKCLFCRKPITINLSELNCTCPLCGRPVYYTGSNVEQIIELRSSNTTEHAKSKSDIFAVNKEKQEPANLTEDTSAGKDKPSSTTSGYKGNPNAYLEASKLLGRDVVSRSSLSKPQGTIACVKCGELCDLDTEYCPKCGERIRVNPLTDSDNQNVLNHKKQATYNPNQSIGIISDPHNPFNSILDTMTNNNTRNAKDESDRIRYINQAVEILKIAVDLLFQLLPQILSAYKASNMKKTILSGNEYWPLPCVKDYYFSSKYETVYSFNKRDLYARYTKERIISEINNAHLHGCFHCNYNEEQLFFEARGYFVSTGVDTFIWSALGLIHNNRKLCSNKSDLEKNILEKIKFSMLSLSREKH